MADGTTALMDGPPEVAMPAYHAGNIPDLLEEPDFQKETPESQSDILDFALSSAYQNDVADSEDPETHAAFGELAANARARITPGWLSRQAHSAAELVKGLPRWAESTALAVGSLVGSLNPALRATGLPQKSAEAIGLQTRDYAEGANQLLMQQSPGGRRLDKSLSTLRGAIDSGKPLNAALTKELQDEIAGSLSEYHVSADYARSHGIGAPENAELLGRYVTTRNPKYWDALRKNLATSKGKEEVNRRMQEMASTELGRAMLEGGDPINVASLVVPALRGVKAVAAARAATLGSTAAGIGKSAAMGGAFGAGMKLKEDPSASLSEVMDSAVPMGVVAGAMHAAPVAARAGWDRLTRVEPPPLPTSDFRSPTSDFASESVAVPDAVMRSGQATVATAPGPEATTPPPAAGSSPAAGSFSEVGGRRSEVGGSPIDRVFDRAMDRLSETEEAGTGLRTQFDPTRTTAGYLNADLINHGVDLIARGIRDFGRWSMEMLRRFGEGIRAYLQDLWDVARTNRGSVGGNVFRDKGDAASGSGGGSGGTPTPHAVPTDTWETPRFSQRVKAAESLKGAWRSAFDPKPYEKRSHAQWDEFRQQAGQWVDQHGAEAAANLVLDQAAELSGDERVILAGEALRAADARAAAGDAAGDAISREMGDFLGTFGSRSGQTVAAYGYLVERDPTLVLAEAVRGSTEAIETDARTKLKKDPKEVAAEVKKTADEEKERAVKDTEKRSPAIVSAAQRIIDKFAKTFSDTLSADARKLATDAHKLRDLVARASRNEVADFTDQAMALGVPAAEAELLAQLTAEARRRRAAVKTAQEAQAAAEAPTKAAQQIIDRLAAEFSDTRKEAKAKARTVLQQIHELVRSGMREHNPDLRAQLEALGVDPAEAATLQKLVDNGLLRSQAVAREKAGQKLIASLGPKVARAVRSKLPKFVDALLKAWETGVLGRDEFLDAYAKTFELPHFTPEIRAKMQGLVQAVREAPEGTPKAEAMRSLMDELAIFSGVKAGDALLSAWYSNLLSGLSTQLINIWGNLTNLLLRTPAAAMVNHPADTLQMLAGMLRGAARGGAEFRRIFGGGVQHKTGEKYADSGPLERLHKQGWQRSTPGQRAAMILSAGPVGRYVFRGLSGMDAFFYYTALEGRAQLAASRAARARGLRPGTPEFARSVAEDLGLGSARWQAAIDQATAEAVAGKTSRSSRAINARALEIVEAERPAELRHESQRYGELMTYNYEPEGNAAKIYQAITGLQGVKVFGVPVLRPWVPFARMMANLTSSNLDFFAPIGIARGLKGNYFRAAKDSHMAPWEARERLAAGVLGGAVTAAAASWALSNKEENDTDAGFMVYGMGPKNRELMPKGWKPYSIKIGNKYLSYAETPLVFALAPVGAMMDKMRDTKDWDEKDALERYTYYFRAMGNAMTSQGVLSSMADLMDILRGRKSPVGAISSYTSGMIPAQGLLRDINTLFDGRKIDSNTIGAAIFRDVPVIRGMVGRPALNVWGEPVKFEGLDRIPVVKRVLTGGATPDPVSDWMSRNKLTVPALPQTVDAGQYLSQSNKAANLNRIHAMVWTDAERYEFAKRSGQELRKKLEFIRTFPREAPPTQKFLQKLVDTAVDKARESAMLELIRRVP